MSEYRKDQCERMLEALKGAGLGMTRLEFAKLLGIKKSNHLVALIDELISRGLAEAHYGVNSHNQKVIIYFYLAPNPPEHKDGQSS